MTAEPAVGTVTYYFPKVQTEAGFWLFASNKIHCVGGFARFFHFKTTFWVNHWREKFDFWCKWLVCVHSYVRNTKPHIPAEMNVFDKNTKIIYAKL